ncbi:hypothetical protein YC2023_017501 [Brassica napus]
MGDPSEASWDAGLREFLSRANSHTGCNYYRKKLWRKFNKVLDIQLRELRNRHNFGLQNKVVKINSETNMNFSLQNEVVYQPRQVYLQHEPPIPSAKTLENVSGSFSIRIFCNLKSMDQDLWIYEKDIRCCTPLSREQMQQKLPALELEEDPIQIAEEVEVDH